MGLFRGEGAILGKLLEVLNLGTLLRGEMGLELVMGPKDSQEVSTPFATGASGSVIRHLQLEVGWVSRAAGLTLWAQGRGLPGCLCAGARPHLLNHKILNSPEQEAEATCRVGDNTLTVRGLSIRKPWGSSLLRETLPSPSSPSLPAPSRTSGTCS